MDTDNQYETPQGAAPAPPGASEAQMPPPAPEEPAGMDAPTVPACGSGDTVDTQAPAAGFPHLGIAGSSGPWSFEEHRLFEQACIMHGWGNWKKIQEAIPGRSKDQCKSHGQKYLKNHPGEKERLIMEHNRIMHLQDNQHKPKAKKSKKKVVPKKAPAAAKKAPPAKVEQPPKKKTEKVVNNWKGPTTYKKESPVLGEAGKAKKKGILSNKPKFAYDSIDVICQDIHQRKLTAGCTRFPLCLCEKKPCARKDLDYNVHVREQKEASKPTVAPAAAASAAAVKTSEGEVASANAETHRTEANKITKPPPSSAVAKTGGTSKKQNVLGAAETNQTAAELNAAEQQLLSMASSMESGGATETLLAQQVAAARSILGQQGAQANNNFGLQGFAQPNYAMRAAALANFGFYGAAPTQQPPSLVQQVLAAQQQALARAYFGQQDAPQINFGQQQAPQANNFLQQFWASQDNGNGFAGRWEGV